MCNEPSPLVVKLGSKYFIIPLVVLITSIKFQFYLLPTHALRICMWLNGCPNRITAPAGTIIWKDFTNFKIILIKVVSIIRDTIDSS